MMSMVGRIAKGEGMADTNVNKCVVPELLFMPSKIYIQKR